MYMYMYLYVYLFLQGSKPLEVGGDKAGVDQEYAPLHWDADISLTDALTTLPQHHTWALDLSTNLQHTTYNKCTVVVHCTHTLYDAVRRRIL